MSTLYLTMVATIMTVTVEKTPLQEYGDVLVGRWVGDITLVADWPEVGSKGEKVVAYETVRWILDGHALEVEGRVGTGAGKTIIVWDPVSQTIREYGTSAGTGSWSGVTRKVDDAWITEGTGFLPDGTKTSGTSKLVFSDEGRVRTYTGSGHVGDEEHLPLHDVYTKVSVAMEEATPLKPFGDLLVGRWQGDVKWVTDWPNMGKRGERATVYVDFEWIADGHAVQMVYQGGSGKGLGIIYWDAAAQQIRQSVVFTNGLTRQEVLCREGDTAKWRAEQSGSLGDGTELVGTAYLEFQDDGRTAVNTGQVTIGGQQQDPFRDVYTKLSQ